MQIALVQNRSDCIEISTLREKYCLYSKELSPRGLSICWPVKLLHKVCELNSVYCGRVIYWDLICPVGAAGQGNNPVLTWSWPRHGLHHSLTPTALFQHESFAIIVLVIECKNNRFHCWQVVLLWVGFSRRGKKNHLRSVVQATVTFSLGEVALTEWF